MMLKAQAEMNYWLQVKQKEKKEVLGNSHYEYFYTKHFNIAKSFFAGNRILDIGCGPRGSLEWCDAASQRVGLDPLAKSYRQLGIDFHKMLYVASGAENIPFADEYFHVVASFNSLDHVDNLDKSIAEIIRVLKPGGMFLLITDVNHGPTATEPISFSWDIVNKFQPGLTLFEKHHYEKSENGIYKSIMAAIPYDHSNPAGRYGILTAKFQKCF